MNFPLNLYVVAFLGAALSSAIALPLWRAICLRVGLVDEPGPRKIHHKPVALAGGLAVLTGLCVPVLLGVMFFIWAGSVGAPPLVDSAGAWQLSYGLGRRASQLLGIVLGALAMACLGLVDDKVELRAGTKFVGQIAIAVVVALTGTRITLFVPSTLFSYLITVLWIVTVTNALNFMDNMNGLCTGLGVIGAWYFGLCAAAAGQYLVAVMAFLMCGALAGFMPYNFPKATAFLGDSGSQLVGYMMAVLGMLPHFYTPEKPRPIAVLTPLFVLAVPLADIVWVVGLRLVERRPIYVGDTSHLSHQLVRRGLSECRAVLVLLLVATATGSLGFFIAS